jgi:hypothetical protein
MSLSVDKRWLLPEKKSQLNHYILLIGKMTHSQPKELSQGKKKKKKARESRRMTLK